MCFFKLNISLIKGNSNSVTQDSSAIERSEKLQQSLIVKLGELQKSSPYSISAIEVNDTNINTQEEPIKRESLISKIGELLDEHKCVILNGDLLIGKTYLAEQVGLSKKDLNPLIIRTFYNPALDPIALIPVVAESEKCKLLIIDALPDYEVEVVESLCQVIHNVINKGLQVLITARSFNSIIAKKFDFAQYTVPAITIEELKSSMPQCPDGLAKLVISTSGGYPMLINLLLFYLNVNKWKLSEQQIIDFISIPNKEDVKGYVAKKIRDIITDTQDLQMLSRLSLFWRPFTEDDAVSIAGVNPMLITPKDRISRLISQGLLLRQDGRLKVSPFVKKIWTADLLELELKECSCKIIDQLINKQTIDIYDADNVILLLCNAKEYERAGWFYASFMTKLLELRIQDVPQVSLLTMLWKDLPLPSEMTVLTRTFIRLLQVQLAHLTNEDSSYATNDLVCLIDELPLTNPLKAVASCYAISELSLSGNLQKALPLLQYAQPAISSDLNEEYLAIVREQQDISSKLPAMMLSGIKNLEDLMQWFDKVNQSAIPTDCIDVDAVKFALNRVVEIGKEEAVLRAIINRVKGEEKHQVFLIVTVARLMLYLSENKRYEDSWELYESNKSLVQTTLGAILINNALACYYHDCKDIEKALGCWELACSGNALSICPDEVTFAKSTMASIYSERKDYVSSVSCVEDVVKSDSFSSELFEYQQMQMRGELAIAYWANEQREDSFEQLFIIHNYLYAHRLEIDENYKLLEMKFGICVQQYHYMLEQGKYAEEFVKPLPTLFQRPNKEFLEVYNKARTGTNVMFLFMTAASLNAPKDTALLLAHHTIECFSELIEENNIACGLLTELAPLLLEYGEYEIAEYLIKSSLGLASAISDAPSPVTLLSYLPLVPLCLRRVIDCSLGNSDIIDRAIITHIQESLAIFSDEEELKCLRDVIINRDISRYDAIKEDNVRISARVYNFEQLNVPSSVNVIIIASMLFQVHKYYGNGLLRLYVYHHAKYLLDKFASNFRSAYKNPCEELESVQRSSLDDLEVVKKMIRLLAGFSKIEIPMTQEQEKFIGI